MDGYRQHLPVPSRVAIGCGQPYILSEGLPQAAHLFRASAVRTVQVPGEASFSVEGQPRAQEMVCAQAAGEGRDEALRRGGDDDQGRPPRAPVAPGIQCVRPQEAAGTGLSVGAGARFQVMQGRAGKEPPGSGALEESPIPLRQVRSQARAPAFQDRKSVKLSRTVSVPSKSKATIPTGREGSSARSSSGSTADWSRLSGGTGTVRPGSSAIHPKGPNCEDSPHDDNATGLRYRLRVRTSDLSLGPAWGTVKTSATRHR